MPELIHVLDGDAAGAYAEPVFALYDTVFADLPDENTWREQMYDRQVMGLRLPLDGGS